MSMSKNDQSQLWASIWTGNLFQSSRFDVSIENFAKYTAANDKLFNESEMPKHVPIRLYLLNNPPKMDLFNTLTPAGTIYHFILNFVYFRRTEFTL